MGVRRVVVNIAAADVEPAKAFYGDLFGMAVVMDFGWIATFGGQGLAPPQVSVATEGGGGTPVPDISIEVDDLDDLHARAVAAGHAIEYGPIDEPWGVRRFFLRDPFGRLVNVLAHH